MRRCGSFVYALALWVVHQSFPDFLQSRRRSARVDAMVIDNESRKEPPAPLCRQCGAPMVLDRDRMVPAAMSRSELTAYTCRACGTTVILLDEV